MKYFADDRYLMMSMPPWDVLKAWLTPEQFTGYLLGDALVDLARFNVRAPGKGGLPDLLKARKTLDRLIEEESRE